MKQKMHASLSSTLGENATVVLASSSPRRKEILETEMGITNLRVVPSGFPENLDKEQYAPFEYVMQTAIRKALDVYQSEADADCPPDLVLAADTVVVVNGQILEKPLGFDHHVSMLKSLRDSKFPHHVYTGVVAIVPLTKPVVPGYAMESYLGDTEITFKQSLTDEEILEYVTSGEASDAAGGYKIQETASRFVEKITGDKFNAIGLPVTGTIELINKTLGIANNDTDAEGSSEEEY